AGSAGARAGARGAGAARTRGGPRDRRTPCAHVVAGARPGARRRARRAHGERHADGARGRRRVGGARARPSRNPEVVLDKSFDPAAVEQRWYERWESAGYFKQGGTGKPYSIQLPPPNVTGTLHMGHAFQQTLMDALIRYHRMRGFNTNWVVGTDHAGIATQIVVERQLEADGKSRHELGRERFLERAWQWKQQSGSTITRQMRRLGASANWEYADTEGQKGGYFTMDARMSRAVVEVFVRLYEEGLIYRGKRLVNWDPVLGTAVSDLEVDSEETNGTMWRIVYPFVDGPQPSTDPQGRPVKLRGMTIAT